MYLLAIIFIPKRTGEGPPEDGLAEAWAKSKNSVLKAAQGQFASPDRRLSNLSRASRCFGEDNIAVAQADAFAFRRG